jgi:hypothetical protein
VWVFSPFGFFSVVRKRGDSDLTVRSRTRCVPLRLRRHYVPQLAAPAAHGGTDNPWRSRSTSDGVPNGSKPHMRRISEASHGSSRLVENYGQTLGSLVLPCADSYTHTNASHMERLAGRPSEASMMRTVISTVQRRADIRRPEPQADRMAFARCEPVQRPTWLVR